MFHPLLTHECLSQRNRPEATIKEEESLVWVDIQEAGHIQIIRECSRQANNTDHALGRLNLRNMIKAQDQCMK